MQTPFPQFDSSHSAQNMNHNHDLYNPSRQNIEIQANNEEDANQYSLLNKQKMITQNQSIPKKPLSSKKYTHFPLNYIRCSLDYPKINEYDLTEQDIAFVNCYKNKYLINGYPILTKELMKRAIIYLEIRNAKKQKQQLLNQKWILQLLDHATADCIITNQTNFSDPILSYWKYKRQQNKFPLYRPLWSTYRYKDFSGSFKPRTKKRNILYGKTKSEKYQILKEIQENFRQVSSVCQMVCKRQQLKHKTTILQIKAFFNQINHFINLPQSVLPNIAVQNSLLYSNIFQFTKSQPDQQLFILQMLNRFQIQDKKINDSNIIKDKEIYQEQHSSAKYNQHLSIKNKSVDESQSQSQLLSRCSSQNHNEGIMVKIQKRQLRPRKTKESSKLKKSITYKNKTICQHRQLRSNLKKKKTDCPGHNSYSDKQYHEQNKKVIQSRYPTRNNKQSQSKSNRSISILSKTQEQRSGPSTRSKTNEIEKPKNTNLKTQNRRQTYKTKNCK